MKRAVTTGKHLIALAGMSLALLFAVSPRSARADVVYTYTGNDFTAAVAPYTTSDYVTATLTFSTALGPNFNATTTPISFALSDGVQTITNSNAIGYYFLLTTNSSGSITSWDVNAVLVLGDFVDTSYVSGTKEDSGEIGGTSGSNLNSPGVWAINGVAIPEPSSWAIVAVAMTVLGWLRRRRPDRLPAPM